MPQPSYAPGIAIPSRRDIETLSSLPDNPAPTEQLSSIHEVTVKILYEANYSLETLLRKLRGAQPEKAGGATSDKVAERHMLGDAFLMRGLASEVMAKATELNHIIGHDK